MNFNKRYLIPKPMTNVIKSKPKSLHHAVYLCYNERDTGYAILTAEGFTTIDEVVFAEEGDMNLLGVHTIEGFHVMVDNIGYRFVALSTLSCPANRALGRKKEDNN